jgi:ATP-dependent Lon protease
VIADNTIDADEVRTLLGRPRVHPEKVGERNEVGVATGMYYTPMGGDIMFIEAAIRRLTGRAPHRRLGRRAMQVSGYGNVSLILTGQLGDVMKESARAALTYAATHAGSLNIPDDRLGSVEVHVHVPAGAIPKDGPSAGTAMSTAIVSAMSGRPVRRDVAMTGEATLRGPRAADRRPQGEGARRPPRGASPRSSSPRRTRPTWRTSPTRCASSSPSTRSRRSTRCSTSRCCRRTGRCTRARR